MKQVLVLYYSRTGNTRKLAEAVCEGVESIEGVRCLLRSTEEVTREDSWSRRESLPVLPYTSGPWLRS
jgi:flavodoxin